MIADSFGSLTEFCICSSWSELVRKHTDPAIDYHVSLYEFVVIGYEVIAARDVVRINMSFLWMLANALRPSLLDGIFSFVQTSLETFVTEL